MLVTHRRTAITYGAVMTIPGTPEERYAEALEEAWIAAERTNRLLRENNITTAAVWAAAAQAWATIAATASLQRPPE